MGYTHGIKWSDEIIEKKILEVIGFLGIERMPSNSEMKKVTQSTSLSNKVAKTYGFKGWAEKLNLQIKSSDTKFGNKYENIIEELLKLKSYSVNKMTTKFPYDLLVNNNIKIDVKAGKRYYYDEDNFYYSFNLEKKNPTCDIYIACCIDNENEIEKMLIIPSKLLNGKCQLSVGNRSKYDDFIDRFDYIEQYDEFYNSLV